MTLLRRGVSRFYQPQEIVDYCVEALSSKHLTAHELAALFDVTDTTIYRWATKQTRTKFEPNRGLKFCQDAVNSDTEACILWPFRTDKDGYGKVSVNRKSLTAHRVVCELVHGKSFDGAFTLHSCDNPSCVNPKHLKWGTALENARDRDQKGRANTAHGTQTNHTVVIEDQVLEIRRIAEPGNFKEIARLYGISRQCVEHIYYRRSWRWLP